MILVSRTLIYIIHEMVISKVAYVKYLTNGHWVQMPKFQAKWNLETKFGLIQLINIMLMTVVTKKCIFISKDMILQWKKCSCFLNFLKISSHLSLLLPCTALLPLLLWGTKKAWELRKFKKHEHFFGDYCHEHHVYEMNKAKFSF